MAGRAMTLVIMGLLAPCAAAADSAILRQLGTSAELRALAAGASTRTSQPAADAGPALRRIAPRITAAAGAQPPHFGLPSGPAAPAMKHVRTGGTRFDIDGVPAGAGQVDAALGDLQYVQVANGQLAVYRKQDGALQLGPVPANAMFFDAPAGPAAQACGDARHVSAAEVHFDQLANRWIVSQRAAAGAAAYLCIAVSAGSDAGGAYHRYALAMQDASGRHLYFDDPHMAVWPDAYYLSANLFEHAAGSYRGPRICGAERQALLRGADARLRCRDLGPGAGALAPASLTGYDTPAGGASPALFLGLDFSAAGRGERLFLWRFSFSANRIEGPLAIPVAPFRIACPDGGACIGQPAPGAPLAALGERLMPRPVYRSGDGRAVLLATHSIEMESGQLGLRWYQIDDPLGAPRVAQQGSFAPDASSRWMGSIGMDQAGNIALGFSVAAPDTPPGIRYTGRVPTDPPGRMQAEEVIFNGNGVQPAPAPEARASGALALDPIDGCTFWYTQRYLPSTGSANWRTRIASFKFEGCR
jgi:hypothetical protein